MEDALVVKRAVDAGLEADAGELPAQTEKSAGDEIDGAIGVVYVSGAMMHVEELGGLGDSGEQGVVAAGPLLLLGKRGTKSGEKRGGENRDEGK